MNDTVLIDVSQVRIGMHIQLDVGWINHPFPVSSFRIISQEQLDTLRATGLQQVRYHPAKSEEAPPGTPSGQEAGTPVLSEQEAAAQRHQQALEIQSQALERCERSFGQATHSYQSIGQWVEQDPGQAHALAHTLVGACVEELLSHEDVVIRLLSEDVGVRSSLHPINVMVLTLLLGRALRLGSAQLHDLGLAALLHDLGKQTLPAHVHEPYNYLPAQDMQRYRSHVGASVAYAERMGLPVAVVLAIAQHHGRADGSGFPLHLWEEDLGQLGQVLALINHYERLCNPSHGGEALTPHEALSIMFAQSQKKFAPEILGIFIRMMGVYPPGSVVQLANDRYAMVVAVNSAHPLRPSVVVYDPAVPKSQALILDLQTTPKLAIRRSLRPAQLPREALDYLSPRQRICYFFERAVGLGINEASF